MFNIAKVQSTFQTVDALTITFGAFDLAPDSTAGINVQLFARATDGTSSFWNIVASAKRVGSGTAAIVGTAVTDKIADSGASTWAMVVGTINSAFNITVTGAAGVTINWGVFGNVLFFTQ